MKYDNLAAYLREHARKNPAKAAVKYNGTVVTYGELERASNRVADILYKKMGKNSSGSCSETINVATVLDRSPEIIISILGILKAGMVFVPIAADIPANRMELLLAETKARWVITTTGHYNRFKEVFEKNNQVSVLTINTFNVGNQPDEPECEMINNKYCYIYFTSGSTGIPKGILGRHKSLHHYIRWQIDEFAIEETCRVSQLIPPTFDPFLRDIFVPLTAGGTICIPGYNTLMNPANLITWIDENNITLIHIVPSLFKLLSGKINNADHFTSLKYVFLAGELLRGNDIRRFIEIFGNRVQLVNQYGPTETTLAKFFYIIKPRDINKTIIPVGKPIKGAEALILDRQGQECLTGNPGEIHIRTPFISSGYFNKKELNKEVFIKNPFSNDEKDILYKTGDIGRLLFDGNIELVGRIDNQIKMRGNRVEPGEIENHLLKLDIIEEAVVVDKEDGLGEKYLCAYIVPVNRNEKPDITQLKILLGRNLPGHMVPSFFVFTDSLPLNPNGKVDRKALKKMGTAVDTKTKKIAPENEPEKKIADAWKEILNLDNVSINDNFFNVGGTSLNAIKINSKINEILNVEMPIVKFFEYPTIRLYAQYLANYLASHSTGISNRDNNPERMNTMTQKRTDMASRRLKLKELKND